MRHLIPALVVTVLGFSITYAAPSKTSPFSNKSFGDGGGYKHPDTAVGEYLEIKPELPAALKPERPQVPAKVAPEIPPSTALPSRPRPRPFAPPAPAPASSDSGTFDAASEDARRDYETRLFGASPEPKRPGLSDSQTLPLTDPTLVSSTGEGMLFVSLELDPREAGALRDAVAGLSASAAFRPDARFQPTPGAGGSVRISGWLPASRLGSAISRPGVTRVEVERGARPAADNRLTGEYLLKLRVSDTAQTEASIAASVRVLAVEADFKLDRVLGVETSPGGVTTALVSGMMPVSRLSHALGLPGIINISSTLPSSEITPVAPDAPAVPTKKAGFLKFVMARGLWLVLLTFLLALPTVGEAVKNGLAVFVPYR